MPHPLRTSASTLATAPVYIGIAAQPQVLSNTSDYEKNAIERNAVGAQHRSTANNKSATATELDNLQAAHLAWDKTVSHCYQTLIKHLPRAEKLALQLAQRQWLAWRNAQWATMDARYAGKDGAIYQVFFATKRLQITKQRALALREYCSSITKH